MSGEINLKAGKVKNKKKIVKITKIALLVFIALLFILYIVMGIIYSSGNFSITLDRNLYFDKGLIIYDDNNYKVFRTELYANSVDSFDNISYKWLPDDLDEYEGSHNGENYVAYSFYIENVGTDVEDYWSEVIIDDSIRNVDEAVRIRVYKNGEYTTYAKLGSNGQPETDTTPFESDDLVALDHVSNFAPGDKNKYTVVLWLEGSDPECTDNILGGEIKVHMAFNSENVN